MFSEPNVILHRGFTVPAPTRRPMGKDWDTVKPLSRWFSPPMLARVVLVDDDAHKVLPADNFNRACNGAFYIFVRQIQAICLRCSALSGPGC